MPTLELIVDKLDMPATSGVQDIEVWSGGVNDETMEVSIRRPGEDDVTIDLPAAEARVLAAMLNRAAARVEGHGLDTATATAEIAKLREQVKYLESENDAIRNMEDAVAAGR